MIPRPCCASYWFIERFRYIPALKLCHPRLTIPIPATRTASTGSAGLKVPFIFICFQSLHKDYAYRSSYEVKTRG